MSLEKEKNNAYWERNQLVSALSKVFPSFLTKHPEEDKEWEDDWRNIVVVHLPKTDKRNDETYHTDGKSYGYENPEYYQLTWHIHDHEMPMFDHLDQTFSHQWDGHTTEQKYRRLRTLKQTKLNSKG